MKKIWIALGTSTFMILTLVNCSSNNNPSGPTQPPLPSYEFKVTGSQLGNVTYSVGSATTMVGQNYNWVCTSPSPGIITCTWVVTGTAIYSPWTYDFSASAGTSYSIDACNWYNNSNVLTVEVYKGGLLADFRVGSGQCTYMGGTLP